MGGDKVLSFEEVAQHNTNGDCWLIIHGKVYDVSKFMEEHPGGEDAMLNVTEKDASADFEEVGHSSDAQERMKDFCIGEIDELTLPSASAAPTPTTASSSINDSSSTFLLYILPLLILGVLFLLRIYSGNE